MSSESPLWESVYAALRRRIESGELPPGAAIPTEAELCNQHAVSRPVARQALMRLQQDGLITQGQGRRGRRVRNPRPIGWRLHEFERGRRRDDATTGHDDWAAGITAQGRSPRQDVAVAVEPVTGDTASALGLPEGALTVHRSRVRYVDDVPYQLSTSLFPEDIARGTLLMEERDVVVPGGILAHIGHPQASIRDTILIRMPTPDEAARLDLAPGIPVGEHRRTGYSASGVPIRHMITVFPGDRHYLVYELDIP